MAKLTPMKAIRKNVLNVLVEVSTKLNCALLKNAPSIRIDLDTDLCRVRKSPTMKLKLKTHKLGADF